jgi:hypothetical protein
MTDRDAFAAAAIAGTFARPFAFKLSLVLARAYAAADEAMRIRALSPAALQAACEWDKRGGSA